MNDELRWTDADKKAAVHQGWWFVFEPPYEIQYAHIFTSEGFGASESAFTDNETATAWVHAHRDDPTCAKALRIMLIARLEGA